MPNIRRIDCPRCGERLIDLDGPVQMCEDCRVIGPDGKPLGWDDGRPTEYVDIDAMYRTGTPASDRLVAETHGLDARREAIHKANVVITHHIQPFDGAPCNCGWPENGLPYAPSHQAHVAERLWDAECLRGI